MNLKHIGLVSIPVTDQDRAMDAATADGAGAGARWVMLSPPGGGADITLVTWSGDAMPPGSAKLAIACDNADEAYAELTALGVKPNNEAEDAPWGRWLGVDDPDGNNWLITQERDGS